MALQQRGHSPLTKQTHHTVKCARGMALYRRIDASRTRGEWGSEAQRPCSEGP